MNLKKAKKLRKQVGYHPSDERTYVINAYSKKGKPSIKNDPNSTRGKYLASKRSSK